MGSQHFSLKWNDHQTNMLTVFQQSLSAESLVDVTLACEGHSLKAHKMVLSACSSFFQNLFLQNPCEHPIVIMKDIKYSDLRAVVDFMYHGEVNVTKNQLSQLLEVAETLHIKGLSQLGLMGQKETTEIVQHPTDEPKQFGRPVKIEPGLNSSPSCRRKRHHHRCSSSSDNSDSNYKIVKEAKLGNSPGNEMDLQHRTVDLAPSGTCHQTKCIPSHTQLSCCPHYEEQSANEEYILAVHSSDILRQSLEKDGSASNSVHDHPVATENGLTDNHISPDFTIYAGEYTPSVHATPPLVSQKDNEAYELSYSTIGRCNSSKVQEDAGLQLLNKFCPSISVEDNENHSSNDGNGMCQSLSTSAFDEEKGENATNCFVCEACGLHFEHQDDFVSHRRTTHSELKPCAYITDGKDLPEGCHIQQHAQMHNLDRRFKCLHCKKKFIMKSACFKHLRTHATKTETDSRQHNEETDSDVLLYEERDTVNRVYLCVICHKGFRRKSDLHKHHIIHTGQKPFACDKCGRRFNRKSNLDRHKKMCETKSGHI